MARNQVVGVSVSVGEYQGFPYKNLILHTTRADEHTEGLKTETVKIKYKVLNDALNLNKTAAEIDRLTPADFKNLIGKEITVYYDMYRNVNSVIVYAPEK